MSSFVIWSTCLLLSAGATADPPDVVLIVGDDMGWNDFSFMGSKDVRTPNIDRLAESSAVYPHGYVPSSLCRASLATLLTGQYGHQHKICCNDPPDGVDRTLMHPFMQGAPAIPRLLAKLGYESLQTGKFWEGSFQNAGFTAGMTVKGRHGDDGLAIGRDTMKPIADFLDESKGKPVFVWYAPMLPHQPHNPPERLLKTYETAGRDPHLARYYAMCTWFDETVGELLDILEAKGRRENTLIIFVIDNGWIQLTDGPANKRLGYAPKSKRSPYDGGLRTPILLSWPGKIPPGTRNDLVSTIDLAPTILAACHVEQPASMTGLNLLPSIESHQPLGRDAVFGEIFVHTCIDINRPEVNLTHRWVRRGNWKLIVPADKSESRELYDIERDPFETNNRWSGESAVAGELEERLNDWWAGASP